MSEAVPTSTPISVPTPAPAVTSPTGTGGVRSATVVVAASNSINNTQADLVCTGKEDDKTINEAVNKLLNTGGVIQLLAGNYVLGSSATSYINILNKKGGITLVGSGRGPGTVIEVPEATEAPCAIRAACFALGSQTVKELEVRWQGVPTGATVGIWMQCNEPQVKDVIVNKSPGHAFVLDGEPLKATTAFTPSELGELTKAEREERAANFVNTVAGHVDGCEARSAGLGIHAAGGKAGDAFLVTPFCANSIFTSCFVDGGTGFGSAMLNQEVVNGTEYTELTIYPLTETIQANERILLVNAGVAPISYQQLTVTAEAKKGATKIKVEAFKSTETLKNTTKYTFIVNNTKMITRHGFRLEGLATVNSCHPYWCWAAGIFTRETGANVNGGEVETNGWCNIKILASTILDVSTGVPVAPTSITGVTIYGNPCFANIFALDMEVGAITGNNIDAGTSTYGIYLEEAVGVPVTGNNILNGITGYGSTNSSAGIYLINGERNTVTGNTVRQSAAKVGTHHYGIETFNMKNGIIADNNLQITEPKESALIEGEGTIARGNIGYNPVGKVTPAMEVGKPTKAQPYDQTFYVTAGIGNRKLTISNGPTITVKKETCVSIKVPAGQTLTPEEEVEWVVEGE